MLMSDKGSSLGFENDSSGDDGANQMPPQKTTKTKSTTKSKNNKATGKVPAKRGRKKRPRDMPQRPLSAYNLFFKEKREKITTSQSSKEIIASAETIVNASGDPPSKPVNLFKALAVLISKEWRGLKQEDKSKYEEEAKEEMAKYQEKLGEYQIRCARKKMKRKDHDEDEDADDGSDHDGTSHKKKKKKGAKGKPPKLARKSSGSPQDEDDDPFADEDDPQPAKPGAAMRNMMQQQQQQLGAGALNSGGLGVGQGFQLQGGLGGGLGAAGLGGAGGFGGINPSAGLGAAGIGGFGAGTGAASMDEQLNLQQFRQQLTNQQLGLNSQLSTGAAGNGGNSAAVARLSAGGQQLESTSVGSGGLQNQLYQGSTGQNGPGIDLLLGQQQQQGAPMLQDLDNLRRLQGLQSLGQPMQGMMGGGLGMGQQMGGMGGLQTLGQPMQGMMGAGLGMGQQMGGIGGQQAAGIGGINGLSPDILSLIQQQQRTESLLQQSSAPLGGNDGAGISDLQTQALLLQQSNQAAGAGGGLGTSLGSAGGGVGVPSSNVANDAGAGLPPDTLAMLPAQQNPTQAPKTLIVTMKIDVKDNAKLKHGTLTYMLCLHSVNSVTLALLLLFFYQRPPPV